MIGSVIGLHHILKVHSWGAPTEKFHQLFMNGPWAHPDLNWSRQAWSAFKWRGLFMLLVVTMGSVIGFHHNLLVRHQLVREAPLYLNWSRGAWSAFKWGGLFMLLVVMMGSVIGLRHNLLVRPWVAPTENLHQSHSTGRHLRFMHTACLGHQCAAVCTLCRDQLICSESYWGGYSLVYTAYDLTIWGQFLSLIFFFKWINFWSQADSQNLKEFRDEMILFVLKFFLQYHQFMPTKFAD